MFQVIGFYCSSHFFTVDGVICISVVHCEMANGVIIIISPIYNKHKVSVKPHQISIFYTEYCIPPDTWYVSNTVIKCVYGYSIKTYTLPVTIRTF